MPEGICRQRGPLRRVVSHFLEPLKSYPVGSKIVFEPDSAGRRVGPQRACGRLSIENRSIAAIELAEGETVLEVCLALRQAKQEPLDAWLTIRPMRPEPVRNRGQ